MKQLYRLTIFLFFSYTVVYFSSCYKHPEGCRDVNAINFDISADKDCEKECCRYPKLSLSADIYYDTIKLDTNTVFVNELGDSLRIMNFQMLLSQFQLIDQQNLIHDLYNAVTIGLKGEDAAIIYETINYNAAKISSTGGSSSLGVFKLLADYSGMIFNFGIDSIVNHSKPDKIVVNSPLYPKKDSIYDYSQQEYYFLKFAIVINGNQSREYFVKGDKYLTKFELLNNFNLNERKNHSIKMKIDLKNTLQNFDADNTQDEFMQKFLSNLKSSISFE